MNRTVTTTAAVQPRRREAWIDLLRVVACLLVVFAHCCDGFVGAFDTDRSAFITGALMGSLTRPCVPLFVLMTAMLVMPLGEIGRAHV